MSNHRRTLSDPKTVLKSFQVNFSQQREGFIDEVVVEVNERVPYAEPESVSSIRRRM
jgi:hypothetical protein